MSDDERDPLLKPGRDCDFDECVGRYLREAPAWAHDNPMDIHKAAVGRACDALGPSLLGLIRDVRDGRVGAPEGMGVRYVPFPTPWKMGIAVEAPGEMGYLFAVDLDVPLHESPSLTARREAASEARRAELAAKGLTGDALDEAVFMDSIFGNIAEEDEIGKGGALPDDLPDPDGVDRIDEIRLSRYALPLGDVPVGTDAASVEALAAAARNSLGHGLDAVVSTTARGDYLGRDQQVFETSPSRPPYGDDPEDMGWRPGRVDLGDPVAWMRGLELLRPLLAASGRLGAVAEAAREVAGRVYWTPADGHGVVEEEMGQALALFDGGLPGRGASEAMAGFEARLVSLALSHRLGDLAILADGLARAEGELDKGRFVYNDLDNSASRSLVGGTEVLSLKDQNGQFVVAFARDAEGAVSSLSAARYGRSVQDFLKGRYSKGPVTVEEIGYSSFHREVANPADPKAPLGRAEATVAVASGRTGYPGFLGSYEVVGGALRCVAPAPFELNVIRDLNTVKSCIEVGRCALEEDFPAAPAP